MPDFTMVVVGCGGGPSENDLSSYLVKCAGDKWDDGILALEAGSGLGALTRIISEDPYLFHDDDDGGEEDEEEPHYPPEIASRVYSRIRSFIITHGHLDHAMSLVMAAGSQLGPSRRIFGVEPTIQVLEGMFNGQVWPKLAAREDELAPEFFYRYRPVDPSELYVPITPAPKPGGGSGGSGGGPSRISARVLPISHGPSDHSDTGTYDSSAWFVRNDATSREFLFFGDVEPDALSRSPKTRAVWREAAPKIASGVLDTIFLECSWRSDRKTEELYGHLSPPHFVDELRNLATEVVLLGRLSTPPPSSSQSRFGFFWRLLGYRPAPPPTLPDIDLQGALKGVKVVVIHCKASSERFDGGRKSIADVISEEVRERVKFAGLGATIVAAKQGMTIHI